MWLRRILALLVAVALVVGAALVRPRLTASGDGPPSRPGGSRLVCVTELAAVCDDPDAVVEDAASTTARLTSANPDVDVWVTVAPWPELAVNARATDGMPDLDSASTGVLARSPVVLAARRDRVDVLAQACDGVGWRCLGASAGAPWEELGGEPGWGRVKVGLDPPSTTATGLVALAQAAAAFFDGAGLDPRLLEDPAWFAWVSDLARAARTSAGTPPLERMLLTGAADLELAPVLEATAVPLLRSASGRADDVTLRTLEPVVTADVVVVGYGPDAQEAADAVADGLTDRLVDAGWRRPDGAPPPSETADVTVPADNGMPSAATLQRLRQTWTEVTR